MSLHYQIFLQGEKGDPGPAGPAGNPGPPAVFDRVKKIKN